MKNWEIKNFGEMVFNDSIMKKMLPKKTYMDFDKSRKKGFLVNINEANIIAETMKEWAITKGATHFTHWFQPLTNITAEKHDSFVDVLSDGRGIMSFSGKELIKGEPDASSFPSGGIRNTFEARGYTAWDLNSYAFVKDKVLYIPTVFCSYNGDALDKKTPLLKSMETLSKEAVKLLKICGIKNVDRVLQYAGPEQEYFLIDKELYKKRPDLRYTGRTLFGAKPIKSQELSDHYFGIIKPRVKEFMEEVNEELWKLGVVAKTEHNEVAPSQHEIAVKYMSSNIATDQNQLIMELLAKVAEKHKMACLLHEKPFDGVNGSGKHNNWSIGTDKGFNLLAPSKNIKENLIFLLFLVAVIKAVDDYQDLLRLSVATASNDYRLGGNEAPPAIISIFLGDELTDVLMNIEKETNVDLNKKNILDIGVKSIPNLQKDISDRNRTSPFAFTGNKFEFRMLGSSNSIACANLMLNAAVADTLRIFSEELSGDGNIEKKIIDLIKRVVKKHKRIIFNGNGYDKSWEIEAKKRKLENIKYTPMAVETILRKKNVDMLTRTGVFSKSEIMSRHNILLGNYYETKIIEIKCMIDMVSRLIIPSIEEYLDKLLRMGTYYKSLKLKTYNLYDKNEIKFLTSAINKICAINEKLIGMLKKCEKLSDKGEAAKFISKDLVPVMTALREASDEVEIKMPYSMWPMPTYNDLLYSI